MSIVFKTGNMFDQPAEAIVNTVNCVGAMGKGVALEFKNRWPENYKAYKKLCQQKKLRPGILYVHDNGDLIDDGYRYLINLPTKIDWRNNSRSEYISAGLDALVKEIESRNIRSIVIPALGCGNGGLNWNDIRPMIVERLDACDDVAIFLFDPPGYTPEIPLQTAPKATFERALLLKAIDEIPLISTASVHQAVQELQRKGVNYGMEFIDTTPPHCPRLEDALMAMRKRDLLSIEGGIIAIRPLARDIIATLKGPSLLQANQLIASVVDLIPDPDISSIGTSR